MNMTDDLQERITTQVAQERQIELQKLNDLRAGGLEMFNELYKVVCQYSLNFQVAQSTMAKVGGLKPLTVTDWLEGNRCTYGDGENVFEIAEMQFDQMYFFWQLSDKLDTQ